MDAPEGFSIREYVLGMRSVHVVKCWPFDETSTEESLMKSMLPPITVKNFVWWVDYLQYLEAESSKNKKKLLESGESSESEAMGAINSRKCSKSRARKKKRSVLELFAAAAPVKRVSTDEEDNGFHEEDEFRKKENKKYKLIVSSKLKKATKVINKIKKTASLHRRGGDKMDLSAQRKENGFMQKLHQDQAVGNRNSSDTRGNENDIRSLVSLNKKNPRRQHRNAAKNTPASCKAFRLIAQSQHQTNMKPGILKNHAKAFLLQKTSLPNHDGKHKADKHVTFLEKDSLHRRQRKSFLLEESSDQMQPYNTSDLQNAKHTDGFGNDPTVMGTGENDDVSNRMEDEADCRFTDKEQSTIPSCPVDATPIMKQCNKKEPFGRFIVGKTQDWCRVEPCNISYDSMSAPPRFSYNSQNMKVTALPSCSTGGILIKDFGARYNAPSVSIVGKRANNISQPGLLQSVCSRAENISGEGIGSISEGFVGLPLNSKGELFMLNPNAKSGLKDIMVQNTTASPSISLSVPNTFSKCFAQHSEHSSWDCRTSSRDGSSLFPSKGYLKENHLVFLPSRLGMKEYEANRITSLDLDLIKIGHHSFCQEASLCKEGGEIPEAYGNDDSILPTMRLMGKEFVVSGRQGFQEFETGHVWKDKQTIDELRFSNMSINSGVVHDRNDPSSGKIRETSFHPLDVMTVDHSSTNRASFRPFERSYHSLSPGNGSSIYNSESSFPKLFPTPYEPEICPMDLPLSPDANQHPCPGVTSSDFQLIKKLNLPPSLRSTIKYSLEHPYLEGCVQSSWTRSPDMNRSPLFLDATEKDTLMNKFPCHRNFGSSTPHPCLITGTNHQADSLVPLKSNTSCMNNSLIGSTLQSRPIRASSPPTLSTQKVPVLSFPTVLPMSSVREKHGNQKIRARINSRFGFRARLHGGIAKRQPSAVSDASLKTARAPLFTLEEGSQCHNSKSTTYVNNFEDAQMIDTLPSCPATKKFDTGGDDHLDQRIHSWTDSCSCTAKACQQISQSRSRSGHSNTQLPASAPAGWQEDDIC